MIFSKLRHKKNTSEDVDNLTDEQIASGEIHQQFKFFNWMQSFTKVIVNITFILYIIMASSSLIMIIIQYFQTGTLDINTVISESNLTFREVIGGYIVKAAVENVSKSVALVAEKFFQYKDKELGVNSTPSQNNFQNISTDLDDPLYYGNANNEENYTPESYESTSEEDSQGEEYDNQVEASDNIDDTNEEENTNA